MVNLQSCGRITAVAVLLALFALLGGPAQAQTTASARVDREQVRLGGFLRLEVEVMGDGTRPDFSVLDGDFVRHGTSEAVNTRFENGQLSTARTWSLQLSPRREGKLRIPTFDIGGGQTAPLAITVLPVAGRGAGSVAGADAAGAAAAGAGDPPQLFMEAVLSATDDGQPLGSGSVYVGQQLLLSLRLYYDDQLVDGRISGPTASGADVQPFDNDLRYNKTLDGRSYRVIEKRYAVIANRVGGVRIDRAVFVGELRSARRGDAFRSLFGAGERVRVVSEPLRFDARARPAGVAASDWLPAREVALTETLSDSAGALAVGEPLTRTITLAGVGLTAEQLPALPELTPDGGRSYADRPETDTRIRDGRWLVGSRVERIAIIADAPGELTLPAVSVQWWDVASDQPRTATLPARTVTVTAAALPPGAGATPAVSDAGTSQRPLWPPRWPPDWDDVRTWQYATAALALAWLLTALGWRRTGGTDDVPSHPVAAQPPAELSGAQAALRAACNANDAAGARSAVLSVAQALWQERPPRALAEVADRAGAPALAAALAEVDAAVYAGQPGERWQGKALLAAARAHLTPAATPQQTPASRLDMALPPLYPR